jgi:hypothetical protein
MRYIRIKDRLINMSFVVAIDMYHSSSKAGKRYSVRMELQSGRSLMVTCEDEKEAKELLDELERILLPAHPLNQYEFNVTNY